jgi:hypothetical protein
MKTPSMKHELILKYKNQLKSFDDQKVIIPMGFEDKFWEWFENKSKMFELKKVRKKLRATNIPIVENNFCFKNTYRIAKGFIKRLFYYEGFSYSNRTESATKHAFNVCKNGKVNDYSLKDKPNEKQDYYIGVKIPLSFARKIYKEKGDYKFAQDSLLVAYFMYINGIKGYMQYTEP